MLVKGSKGRYESAEGRNNSSGGRCGLVGWKVQPNGILRPEKCQVPLGGRRVRPSKRKVRPSGRKVRPSKSEVRPHKSKERPSKGKVRPSGRKELSGQEGATK